MTVRLTRLWRSFTTANDKPQWIANKIAATLYTIDQSRMWRCFRKELRKQQLVNQAFDRRYGTDTAGEIDLVETGVSAEDAARGNAVYRPVWESDFRAALVALKTTFDGFTFIDVGSGKGKLLMLASDYPFAKIIGVEYSPGLHAVAQNNIARYRSPTQRCNALESILGDALKYRLPEGPLVCCIFNALDPGTMRQVMQKIELDVMSRQESVYVIYANLRRVSEIKDALENVHLHKLKQTKKLIVFANDVAARNYRSNR